MVTIYCNKKQHRFDNPAKPLIQTADEGDYAKLFIRDYLYTEMPKSHNFLWSPPNRTDSGLKIEIRDLILSAWTISTGVTNTTNNFVKTAAEGFSGAYAANIAAGNCSIEGKPTNIFCNTVFALQSGTFSFDYFNPSGDVEHALVFNQTSDAVRGLGRIIERGVIKKVFLWDVGDCGLVELIDDVVRYYQIKASGEKILLRAKRSLLEYPVTPTLVLYHVGAGANDVRIWDGSGAETEIDLIGVLEDFQDWENQGQIESLADKTMTKDKIEDFTYFSDLKNLLSLSLSIRWDEKENYDKFLQFYQWHDLSRPFIFKDAARKKEFFARFVSSFKDNPLGGDIFGMAVDIRQEIEPPLLLDFI